VDIPITDDYGNVLIPGNALESVLTSPDIPYADLFSLTSAASNYRSHNIINWLTFGNNDIPFTGTISSTYTIPTLAFNLSTNPLFQSRFGLRRLTIVSENPSMPILLSPAGRTLFDSQNTAIFNFGFTTLTATWVFPASAVAGTNLVASFGWYPQPGNVTPDIIAVGAGFNIPAGGGTHTQSYFLPVNSNQSFTSSSLQVQWSVYIQCTGVNQTIHNTTLTITTPFILSSSVSTGRVGYFNPATNGSYPFGPLNASTLNDDVLHQLQVIID